MDIADQDPPPSTERSALMARVRGKNTKPELVVRSLAHRLGYRFRLHRRELPGSPDLVFPRSHKAIFVHGCFWHRHEGCSHTTTPKTRAAYWNAKFKRNVERDEKAVNALRAIGWSVLIIWECETKDLDTLADKLKSFLDISH
ncbi:very short patch repair endonuclease [Microvirga sp. CF3016]|uniref:very short patch repair endonuclease n=1 Tax=Microvirga sp. CF3016 TaxID=3110181 RepID=UPI002E75FA15|nr:very short patch repair endonuclease [Microvirga sp. CF3016]MEE1611866.1 very short patch repair endonuclease [Microvirga sp. CF3016]